MTEHHGCSTTKARTLQAAMERMFDKMPFLIRTYVHTVHGDLCSTDVLLFLLLCNTKMHEDTLYVTYMKA